MSVQLAIEYMLTIAVIAVAICAVLGAALLACAFVERAIECVGEATIARIVFWAVLAVVASRLLGPSLVDFVVTMHGMLFGG